MCINCESMKFALEKSIEILGQTANTLASMLEGLSSDWTASTGDTSNWSPYDVVGHLIHCEEYDWIPRAEMIMVHGESRAFEPFNRLAQFEVSRQKSLSDLLSEFCKIRTVNLEKLARWRLTPTQLARTGIHPEFGKVTLAQLIATWTVHDLGHIRQVATHMARRYEEEVGPWKQYLSVLKD